MSKIEEELLDIVKNNSEDSYAQIILERKSWPLLYHLSSSRENILNWLSPDKNAKVLEIGAECGALTGLLCRLFGSVLSIDASEDMCQVNKSRHKSFDNLEVITGDYKSILESRDDNYDLITLLGGNYDYSVILPDLEKHLTENGAIILATDNRLGLKFLAGCKSDNDHYATKKELESILNGLNTKYYQFYYPYPDFRFPNSIYSDSHLPDKGDLVKNCRVFDHDRYVFFDESKVYDDIISEGEFPSFSNSYMVVIGPRNEESTIYSKISDDRDYQFQIVTKLISTTDGIKVMKTNKLPEGKNHLNTINNNESKLRSLFGDKVDVCKSVLTDDYIEFEYIEGISLEQELSKTCETSSTSEIYKVLDRAYEIINYMKSGESFSPNNEFTKVFGDVNIPESTVVGNIVNIDLIPANLIKRNNKYTIIDYEWIFDFDIPLEYVFWRVLFSSSAISRLTEGMRDEIYTHYNLSSDRRQTYRDMEESFQKYVSGNSATLHNCDNEASFRSVVVEDLEKEKEQYKNAYIALDNELNIIKNSKSWKILKFFKIVRG